jgi:two-component system LytT family response regulator
MTVKLLRSIIIEDEEESLQLLHNLIIANGQVEVTGSTTDPLQAINMIINLNPDIVFLDIKMPGRSGFDILDDLSKIRSVNPYVVFITAFDEFAVMAFEYAAFDYLLKPIDPQKLAHTIIRCNDSIQSGKKQQTDVLLNSYRKLLFHNVSGIVFIDPAEIVYIEAGGNYSVFHLSNNKTQTVTKLLGKIEEQLPDQCFFRINRSFIINLEYLKKVNIKQLQCILVKNGHEFKCSISRDRIGELVEIMKNRR